jgi:hypothetical protein
MDAGVDGACALGGRAAGAYEREDDNNMESVF